MPEMAADGYSETDLSRNIDRPLRELVGIVLFDPTIVGAALVTNAASSGGGGGDASAANQVTGNASLTALEDALTADSATISSVPSQDTNINLLASNANRRGVIIHNSDAGPLFIKYGATATATTSYTYKIPTGEHWEMPGPIYTGAIDGIWTTSGSGSAVITELT
jgi:hypothetical protein